MALPPVTANSLLNLPAPISAGTLLATPVAIPQQQAIDFSTPGGPGYAAAFQPGSPYSATNLPEFMKDYQQTPSGKFVMNQGILGMPPQIDKVQSLFSQGYAQEYAPLEQQFQESFAFDPSMFGNIYRSGQLIPSAGTIPTYEERQSVDPASAIAGVLGAKELLSYGENLIDKITPSVTVDKQAQEGQTLAEKFEESVTQPVKKAVVDPAVQAWQESDIKKSIDTAYTTQKEYVRDAGLRDIENSTKKFLTKLDEKYDKPTWLNTFQEQVLPSGKTAFEAYGNIENFAENPTPEKLFKATDSIQELNAFLPQDLQIELPGDVVGGLADASAGLALVNAFEDPTAENLAQAYGAADHIAMNYASGDISTGLPGAENIAGIGNIIGGVKALEGGIESPGEAIQAATGLATAASMLGTGAVASTGTAALGVLGPVGAGLAVAGLLGSGRESASFGTADVGFDANANKFFVGEESSKKGAGQAVIPEAQATELVLNELTQNYGYEVDPQKIKDVDTKVSYDKGQFARGVNDIIIDALDSGALKPTANTPSGIDFGTMFDEARQLTEFGYGSKQPLFDTVTDFKNYNERVEGLGQDAYIQGPFGPILVAPTPSPVNEYKMSSGLEGLDFSNLFGGKPLTLTF